MDGEQKFVDIISKADRIFRLHVQSFAVGGLVLVLAGIAAQERWFFFWSALVWGFLLILHYFYIKSLHISDDWADEHANKVTDKAYDVSHIESLRERYTGGTSPKSRPDARGRRGGVSPQNREDPEK